jgi:antibiotic biosynthesis monooxygenase (ABM) superfamily enzyme
MTAAPQPGRSAVTIVTQTQVRDGKADAFAAWQEGVGRAAAEFPGFISQTVMPPSPPAQVDWVILQKFESAAAAVGWLRSDRRRVLLDGGLPLLVGRDDIHIVRDGEAGVLPSPVSVVISTRVKAGCEETYRLWERKIAAVQATAQGFQGYRFEPPIPGVQDDWLAILRFDSQDNLDRWLTSRERTALLKEAREFTEEVHARIVRTGFDQWFPAAGERRPPVWKQNMLVLLMLYPVVFLFGTLVQRPVLIDRAGLPFWLALFIGNTVSVILLNWLVPWTSGRFAWWLAARPAPRRGLDIAGAALVVGLYAVTLLIFSQLP